jgi:hypothetical protein
MLAFVATVAIKASILSWQLLNVIVFASLVG